MKVLFILAGQKTHKEHDENWLHGGDVAVGDVLRHSRRLLLRKGAEGSWFEKWSDKNEVFFLAPDYVG